MQIWLLHFKKGYFLTRQKKETNSFFVILFYLKCSDKVTHPVFAQ